MLGSWWKREEYNQADDNAQYFVEEPGLTASHIEAFTRYTESLRKPAETEAQKRIGLAFSVGAIVVIGACGWIALNLYGKYDENMQNLAITSAVSCLTFLAGKSFK